MAKWQTSVSTTLVYDQMHCCVTSSTVRLFADDTVLYTADLQRDLDALQALECKWLMESNPSKCQILQVTLKHKLVEASYTIHGQTLELVESAKYLSVTTDSKLNFNNHIDSVTKKTNGTRAFLNHKLKSCSHSIRDSTYKMYIRPMVEYASTIWDLHTHRNTNRLEQVQRHSACYVTGNHDYTGSISAMLHDLEWPIMEQHHHLSCLTMLYKIYNHLVDNDFTSQLTLTQSSITGHASSFLQPQCSCAAYSNSFLPPTIWYWNALAMDPHFFRLLMPSRTTSSMIRHLITSIF